VNPIADAAFTAFSILWLATGMLIVGRRARNVAGWIFIAIGATAPLLAFAGSLVAYGAKARPGSIPALGAAAVVGDSGFVAVALVPLLFLWYPDGRPPSPRWRWASRALFAGVTASALAFLLKPGPLNNYVDNGILYENPLGIRSFRFAGVIIAIGTTLSLLAALSTVVAVVFRFRRSRGEERQQMRWLVFIAGTAGVLFAVLIVSSGIVELLLNETSASETLNVFDVLFGAVAVVLAFGVPVGYLIAIFRYRLYDIDVVIKKTVMFAVLLLIATVVYGAVVALVGAATVWQNAPPLVFLIGILLGLAFPLVRSRARRLADRIVYGRRATPYEVLTEFSERMGETYATEDVLVRMARILAEGAGATSARVWLRVGSELRVEAAWPDGTTGATTLPVGGDAMPPLPAGEEAFEVRHQGELLGALSVAMSASDPMNPTKAKLVSDLAAQAGLMLRNVRLTEELRQNLLELKASRQRIVAAQDAERRRLERNIHDGAQQQLVSLSVRLGLLKTLASKDPSQLDDVISGLQQEAQESLENLRDLARGIYPPLLADQGLVPALQSQARKASVPVVIESDGVGRHPQDAEAAVYFCVLEALQNVTKYAEASRATVRLFEESGALVFEVSDDGKGFDSSMESYGTGLQGMADRLAALDGTLEVDSAPGRGTRVIGRIPTRAMRMVGATIE
jgi:signal transduction histidine kinase